MHRFRRHPDTRWMPWGRCVSWWRAGFLVCVLAMSAMSCSRKDAELLRLAVAEPVIQSPESSQQLALIKELYPQAAAFSVSDLSSQSELLVKQRYILLLPGAEHIPLHMWPAVKSFLEAGGKALFIGRGPFSGRVVQADDVYVTERDSVRMYVDRAVEVDGFSSVQLWRHLNESGVMRGSVRPVRDTVLSWPGIEVVVEGFQDWDNVSINDVNLGRDAQGLAFYARAQTPVSRLVVTCTEKDGSVWYRVVPLTERWSPHLLWAEDFSYFYGGRERGGEKDRLNLPMVRTVSAGLSMHLAPQSAGDAQFGISDVRVVRDSGIARQLAIEPDLLCAAPWYRYYKTEAAEVVSLRSGDRYPIHPSPVYSPLPRERGRGGLAAAPYRWIPLYEARDRHGERRGWPASICVTEDGKAWGWIGLSRPLETRPAMIAVLRESIERLQPGSFLLKGGTDQYAFDAGDLLEVQAAWAEGPEDRGELRVVAELLDADGRSLRRVVSSPAMHVQEDDGYWSAELHLGRCPDPGYYPSDYEIRILLEHAGVSSRLSDEMIQPVKVLTRLREPRERDWLRSTGGRFRLGKVGIFLFGINYWPLSTNGRKPGDYNKHWLDVSVFNPEDIRRDLDLLQSAGFNAVAIQYHEENQAPQLSYFLEELKKRAMWAMVYLPHLSPLDFDPDKAKALIDSAALTRRPEVFAFDLAWEPRFGRYERRRVMDQAWQAWIEEQYGTVEHAEALWDYPVWRREGQVTGPPDESLTETGKHNLAVMAYRRFAQDWVSRRYGFIKRTLRGWGCQQMLSARTGYGGTGSTWAEPFMPFDPAAGAVHLDFISPEGWGLNGPREKFMEAGFITAYARGVSDGKPVVWSEFGSSVGRDPGRTEFIQQESTYRNMYELVQNSLSAGCFAWWYPSGYRVDERSDMGVVHPDGRWRPVGDTCRKYARSLSTRNANVRGWQGREFDPWDGDGALSTLWDKWRDVYQEETQKDEIQEIRPEHFGESSIEVEPVTLGDAAYQAPAPFEHLNAEWEGADVDGMSLQRAPGSPLRVKAGGVVTLRALNTGPSTWAASERGKNGTVWVQASGEGQTPFLLPVSRTAFAEHVEVSWTARNRGVWRFRMFLEPYGAFGEELRLDVE